LLLEKGSSKTTQALRVVQHGISARAKATFRHTKLFFNGSGETSDQPETLEDIYILFNLDFF